MGAPAESLVEQPCERGSRRAAGTCALDHAAFRRNALNAENVIDSKDLERDLRGKTASHFFASRSKGSIALEDPAPLRLSQPQPVPFPVILDEDDAGRFEG
ncbi:hypothetical protein DSM21852_07560 [Methylocystis bryophila]|nr:hypothetical protein DSM21852_07560 [Methylocystis bryophila]